MSISRRSLIADGSFAGVLAAMTSEISNAQLTSRATEVEDAPHDSYSFWNGFFDSVNPNSPKTVTRGPKDQLPDPAVQTHYLQFNAKEKKLRFVSDIGKDELLDHDGDIAVNIALSEYRPGASTAQGGSRAVQLRVDTTQTKPFMGLLSPLAWSAIANVAGGASLSSLGFGSPQATAGTSKILLTGGSGKMAVNISMAPKTSVFVKALNVILQGVKTAAPLVTLPALSIPALDAFTQAMSFWEDRTRFVMAGNLNPVVATQQAAEAPDHPATGYMGLVTGDYLMVAQEHTDALTKELPNLDLAQGYLVRKDADKNLPLQTRAASVLPEVSYFSMRLSVVPMDSNASGDDSQAAS